MMVTKVAIVADGNQTNSIVPNEFEAGQYLLIYDTEDDSFEPFINPESSRLSGLAMVDKAVKEDCEVIISGSIKAIAFEQLASAQITRYDGSGLEVKHAIGLMNRYELDYFRVPRGEVWVPHDHGHQKCN